MKQILIALIRTYQYFFSPDTGIFFSWRGRKTCRFYPTCSEYMIRAIEKYGAVRGTWKGIKRMTRCTPGRGPEVDEP